MIIYCRYTKEESQTLRIISAGNIVKPSIYTNGLFNFTEDALSNYLIHSFYSNNFIFIVVIDEDDEGLCINF